MNLAQSHTPLPSPHPCRYEDEINKRTAAENEFVGLKKVSRDLQPRSEPVLPALRRQKQELCLKPAWATWRNQASKKGLGIQSRIRAYPAFPLVKIQH